MNETPARITSRGQRLVENKGTGGYYGLLGGMHFVAAGDVGHRFFGIGIRLEE